MRTGLLAIAVAWMALAGCGGSGLGDGNSDVAANSGPSKPDAPASSPGVSSTFNVADYGAKGDGTTDDTAAIQKALNAASAAKGTVTFPQGTFMTGALFIGSNTTVQIDEGVTLKAIQAPTWWNIRTTVASGATNGFTPDGLSLYPQVPTRVQGIEMNWASAIINVRDSDNVTITGKGVIDGNGQSWWSHYYSDGTSSHSSLGVTWALNWDEQRPRGIETYKSTHVTIKDVTVQNSPFWTVHLCYSDQVHLDGVKVYNFPNATTGIMPSTDGIDMDSSTNVLVENADIVANDDGFVIKSGRDGDGLRVNKPTANVLIRNSVVRAGATAFTIGSETSGGANNIEVSNIKVTPLTGQINSNVGYKAGGPAVYSVFVFKSAPTRGGTMENVYIHDINVDDAYYFMQGNENWPAGGTVPATFGSTYLEPGYWPSILAMPATASDGYPIFRNFRFENITMKHVESAVFGVAGYTIAGEAEKGRFTNFTFNNVNIKAVKSSGASVGAGSIANAGNWTFTNSTIKDAGGANLVPTLAATSTNVTGLPGQ
ncbi:glycoside hydrolase family 28 protein [Paraburkholderia sp.]|uniref:glycoside hydrolase family 28 protein n=1 Tax=Paraburkholderia sp. TaxID=1926495 RepID=UPI002F3F6C3A